MPGTLQIYWTGATWYGNYRAKAQQGNINITECSVSFETDRNSLSSDMTGGVGNGCIVQFVVQYLQ